MKKTIVLILTLVLALSSLPISVSAADLSGKTTPKKTYTFSSIDSSAASSNHNRVKLTLSKDKNMLLSVNYQCEISAYQYRIGLSPLGKGGFITLGYVKPKKLSKNAGNKFTFKVKMSKYNVKSGYYYINISRARTSSQVARYKYGDGGNCYRNALIKVESGKAAFMSFESIIKQNESVRASSVINNPEYFKDKTLEDIPICLTKVKETKSKKPSSLKAVNASLTSSQLKYIKKVALRITEKQTTKYKKAKAIYSYVCKNTYYDVYSNKHSAVDTTNNPYTNIKKIESGKKAYTCCIGYSSMMTALLRSIGIASRVVYGVHLSIPQESWKSIKNTKNLRDDDHYWVNFYDGKRWVTADANMGTSNKWYRDKSLYKGGNKGKKAQNNFTYFDPSQKQLAVSHCCIGVCSRTLISAENDLKKLSSFLNIKDSSGKSNSKKLGGKSSVSSKEAVKSWNKELFYSNNLTGEIEKINFAGNNKLIGAADFSSCKGLKWFSVTHNNITSLNLKGDRALISAHASGCRLKSVDARKCKNLIVLNVKYNPLESAEYSFNKTKTATIKATDGGTFYVGYENGKHTMVAAPDSGYSFLGWYNSSGKKISSSLQYSTKTKSSFSYTARFES
ncbi:MAG: transglutaminase domain-containing protein [Eubacterium sp.]|nr:transglutaminase domain-containing protein [Eubacterium sp.]